VPGVSRRHRLHNRTSEDRTASPTVNLLQEVVMSSTDKQYVLNRREAAEAAAASAEAARQEAVARRVVRMEERGEDPTEAYSAEMLEWAADAITARRTQRAAELEADHHHPWPL
jgi:hypothetical protein